MNFAHLFNIHQECRLDLQIRYIPNLLQPLISILRNIKSVHLMMIINNTNERPNIITKHNRGIIYIKQ